MAFNYPSLACWGTQAVGQANQQPGIKSLFLIVNIDASESE